MAQQIQTVLWCDPCVNHDGSEVPALTYSVTLTLPGERPQSYEIELCDVDAKVLTDVAQLLTQHGRRESRKAPRPAVATALQPASTADAAALHSCPVPDCGYVGRALDSHVKSQHDSTIGELDGSATLPCPEPDCDRKFTAPQGVAAHRRSVHGRVVGD